jgi:hypothetical protein
MRLAQGLRRCRIRQVQHCQTGCEC